MAQFALEPMDETSPAFETLLYFGRQAKEFVENLTAGLDELRADRREDFAFVDGLAPRFLTGKTAAHIRRYSDFLTVFDFDARFDTAASRLYRITETGEVRRVGRGRDRQ